MIRSIFWKVTFSLLGFASFTYVLSGYGFGRLAQDVAGLGWWAIPLALSWAPVVFCYALAWLLITPALGAAHLGILFRFSVISVAWNNLSPFVKVLGEPVRILMLERFMSRKEAARSMVIYNIVHILATLLAFFLGALAILLFFEISEGIKASFLALLLVLPLLVSLIYFLPHLLKRFGRSARRNKLVYAGFWVRWAFSKIRIFSSREPLRFWLAVFFEVLARFVEGLIFYVAFRALKAPVPLLVCSLLDVGRALMDNIFFFIPFQVGSREGGIVLISEHVLSISGGAAVSAAVLYRLVEILWTGFGYLLWIAENRARRSST